MSTINKPIRVAIIGGGLAGVTALHGLVNLPNIDVHIFESADKFREQGLAIVVNRSGFAALDLLGLRDRVTAAGAVQVNCTHTMIAEGPDAGKLAFLATKEGKGSWIVHRASLLKEFLKDLDENRLHPSKKMLKLEEDLDGIKIYFEDGSIHECDILLGADGLHSNVRKHIVGENSPAANPVFAGWWVLWALVPFEAAQKHLGKDLMNPDKPIQYAWSGNGCWVMHDQLSNGTLAQCVIAKRFPEEGDIPRTKKATKEELLDWVKSFDHPIGKNMVDLVTTERNELDLMGMMHHKHKAETYVKGGIAIIGDAADATTPWKGAGGSISMEDAWILSQAFKNAKTVDDAKLALKAYEKIQQPRRQRLIDASHDTGMTVSGCIPEVGLNAEKMKERLENSWEWIHAVDLKKGAADAVRLMSEMKA